MIVYEYMTMMIMMMIMRLKMMTDDCVNSDYGSDDVGRDHNILMSSSSSSS